VDVQGNVNNVIDTTNSSDPKKIIGGSVPPEDHTEDTVMEDSETDQSGYTRVPEKRDIKSPD
jgi:hypothetical protein